MIPELCRLSARALSERIRSRELSPVDIVDAHLAHIEAVDPALNSFITVTGDHARERARVAEAEIAAGGWLGPLHGIPYAPKDILATAGILTTNGSRATADWVPDYESTITARLNAAGAILVGKLNLLEFAMGSGVLSGFGPARNPWATDYTPSGSSSGSGAALAGRLVPLSIGTDTGGSIRGPAAACGVVGLKQTYGRISRFGVTTLSWTLDHAGPMTRTAWDAAAMLGAIAGADLRDPTAADVAVPEYLAGLTPDVAGLRIGVPVSGFFESATDEMQQAVHTAISLLTADGAEVVDIEVPHAHLAGGAGWIVAMAEATTFHE
ncbi:MAG: Asp-tRNA(Asn)/Glu-tRNA(Gln) amidotransferase GatCAB subunit A, partial [Acidobacteria bacterium]|nr:Asp-tRNA(Asn)/Glu-tRNA(Gln) amidotransferase GatCAB subunit A [Acidobacteriota bacterium]